MRLWSQNHSALEATEVESDRARMQRGRAEVASNTAAPNQSALSRGERVGMMEVVMSRRAGLLQCSAGSTLGERVVLNRGKRRWFLARRNKDSRQGKVHPAQGPSVQ